MIRQSGEQRLERIEHDALGADRVDRVLEPDEQSFQIVFAGLLDLAALDVDVSRATIFFCAASLSRSKPSERTFCGQLLGVLLEHHEHARLAEAIAPRTRNSAASMVFPQPAAPHTSVGRPGQAAAGDLIEALDARARLEQTGTFHLLRGLCAARCHPTSSMKFSCLGAGGLKGSNLIRDARRRPSQP